MMKALLILVIVCSAASSRAQSKIPEGYIKKSRLHADSTLTISSLARHFNANYHDEDQRLEAIYKWVIMNISYSTDSVYHINSYADPAARVNKALIRKKGVCENFAAIFTELSNQCGIRSVLIAGYTRQGGRVDKAGHAWVASFTDGKWLLSDPTWDAGKTSPAYYLASPASFIYSHIPFDNLWQLLEPVVTHKNFIAGGIIVNENASADENIYRRINEYLSMNELDQLKSSEKRMKQEEPLNDLIRNETARTKMDIEVIYEDRDMEIYNAAAEDLNKAKRAFNRYLNYRNNEFHPVKPVKEINAMFDPVLSSLQQAESRIRELKNSRASLLLDHSYLEEQVSRLHKKLGEEEQFLKMYFEAEARASQKSSNPSTLKNKKP